MRISREVALTCKHCGDVLTYDQGVLVDTTGGDVCGIASVNGPGTNNDNRPHELTVETAMLTVIYNQIRGKLCVK
jgi:hypothetical protein